MSDGRYAILGFFITYIIILNIVGLVYGVSIIKNADFLNADTKMDYSANIFETLGFLLFATVPTTSNIAGTLAIFQGIYWLSIVPSVIIISLIIVEIIRGI